MFNHGSGAMTAASRIWSSLLSFIVIFTLSSRFLATNSALFSMSVQSSHPFSQSQDLSPFRRVFGHTFRHSTSRNPSCDVRLDVGSTQPYQAILHYSREGLVKLRVTGRRADREVLNIISHFGLFRYRGSRAGRCYRRVLDGEPC